MKVLFIGGTGFISTSVSRMAVARGLELYHLNRGLRKTDLSGVHSLIADVRQPEQARAALGNLEFDAVVDWVAYVPEDIERDLALLRGRTRHYIFISSASAYQKPPAHHVIRESTPLHNPYSEYARGKIACEERLTRAWREEGFPATIVRPSLTYGDANFPIAIGGWGCFTLADRLRKGRPIIVHGDGSSLWVVTHAEDFARGILGLLGNLHAVGDAFHITTDEVLTWNQIYETIADALGVKPKIVHIATDLLARVAPQLSATLVGDKAWSVVFDNTKIKEFVPGYQAVIPFRQGIRRTVAWFEADKSRQRVDPAINAEMDRILAACAA
jgi:nucleoside-diphosphate-sugar epimerase